MPPRKKAAAEPATVQIGTLWRFPASGRVTIHRPDGTAQASPRDGVVSHVLDVPGTYRCGDAEVTAR
jgi:hypothetical protein